MRTLSSKIALAFAGLFLALTFSCAPDGSSGGGGGGSQKAECIREELYYPANTLNDIMNECNASKKEILSQIEGDKVGDCNKTDLELDKSIAEIVMSCGVSEINLVPMPTKNSSSSRGGIGPILPGEKEEPSSSSSKPGGNLGQEERYCLVDNNCFDMIYFNATATDCEYEGGTVYYTLSTCQSNQCNGNTYDYCYYYDYDYDEYCDKIGIEDTPSEYYCTNTRYGEIITCNACVNRGASIWNY